MEVDLTSAIVVAALLIVVYYVYQQNEQGFTSHYIGNDGSNVTQQGLPISPVVGEDNPIVGTWQKLANEGQWNAYESGGDMLQLAQNSLLHESKILTSTEEQRHANYYGSNIGKYPIAARATNVDHKTTIMPYVGGTRAMRGVSIRVGESVVPDKINQPVQPYS